METTLIPYTAANRIPGSAALVFAAHPDDEILGCGGLLAALRSDGVPVDIVIVTSGAYGAPTEETGKLREDESRRAAKCIGGAQIFFWREPDRDVRYNERTISAAIAAIQRANADLVIAPSFYEVHPDHRAVAWIAIEAARRVARERSNLRVALYEVGTPLHHVDTLVDISRWQRVKEEALGCFASQLSVQSYDDQILGLNRFRSYTLGKDVVLAEAFRVLGADELVHPVLLFEPEIHRQERLGLTTARGDQERVCVLIRSLDRDTLARAIDSVALQTYPNIEIHVLNVSGKPHRSCANRAGSFPMVFHDPGAPIGRSAAANMLIDLARGDFILFLDDDDWLGADHVASLVEALRKNPSAAGAYANVEYGEFVNGQWQVEHCFNAQFDVHRLLFENYLPIHSVLFRRILASQTDGACRFDTNFDLFEDWDFWLQLTEHAPLVHVDVNSAFYFHNREGGSNVFAKGEKQRMAMDQLTGKWLSKITPHRYHSFIDYVRETFQNKGRLQAETERLSDEKAGLLVRVEGLEEIIAARDEELWKSQQHTQELTKLIGAHELELANLHKHAAGLGDIVRARDTESEHLRQQLLGLQALVSARELELTNLHEHAANLGDTVRARDTELENLRQELAGFKAIVSARDQEIISLKSEISSQQSEISSLQGEISSLRNEISALQTEVSSLRNESLRDYLRRAWRR